MYNIPDDYELNEKDIESTINWLKIADEQNANAETAIDFLIYLRTVVHQEWHDNPEKLVKFYADYWASKS